MGKNPQSVYDPAAKISPLFMNDHCSFYTDRLSKSSLNRLITTGWILQHSYILITFSKCPDSIIKPKARLEAIMKQQNNRTILLFLVICILGMTLGISSPVLADSGTGTGTLKAVGTGYAKLSGGGTATLSGIGTLFVRDYDGNAVVTVTGKGRKQVLSDGWTRYTGFSGAVVITGKSFGIILTGTRIRLVASGSGRFVLHGRGTYTTGNLSGTWRSDYTEITMK
jgi:hypothetical protein